MSWKKKILIAVCFTTILVTFRSSYTTSSFFENAPEVFERENNGVFVQELKLETYNSNYYTPTESLKTLVRRHSARKERLQKMCNHYEPGSSQEETDQRVSQEDISLLDKIIVDDVHEILYCYVPKVASTNWKKFLMVLTKQINTSDPDTVDPHIVHSFPTFFRRLSNYTLEEITNRIKLYTKFLFVRHPLARFLSAYRDKFEKESPSSIHDSYHEWYGREIIKLYRVNASQESLLHGDDVKFPEFVNYVTDPRPSIENGFYDEHWAPIVDLCMPCKIQYDLIGKHETFADDVWYVMEKTKIGHALRFPPLKVSSDAQLIRRYFQQLTETQMRNLLRVYSEDFHVFGYHTDIP